MLGATFMRSNEKRIPSSAHQRSNNDEDWRGALMATNLLCTKSARACHPPASPSELEGSPPALDLDFGAHCQGAL